MLACCTSVMAVHPSLCIDASFLPPQWEKEEHLRGKNPREGKRHALHIRATILCDCGLRIHVVWGASARFIVWAIICPMLHGWASQQ